MTTSLDIALKKLNFISPKPLVNSELYEGCMFWTGEKHTFCNNKYKNYIRLSLEDADKFDVDAVYFRFFENRPPIPQIYIYDLTDAPFDNERIKEYHRRVWSSGQVPLVYVFTKTEIKIYNTFNKSKEGEEYEVFKQIEIAGKIDFEIKGRNKKMFTHFTADNFDNGSFWEIQEFKKDFVASKNAYETLIKHLKDIRKKIKESKLLPDELADKLLVMSIFVKYLEERKDKRGGTVFPKKFFNKYDGANEFIEVFKNNKAILQLFNDLSRHFNGEIFKLEKNNEINEEQIILNSQNLNEFANFLNEKIDTDKQLTIWRLYSFNDLPVELISNIYEEFIEDKSAGVVYTPPFLVNFLLDEVMPLTDNTTDFKILDPACGSGIFLVQAYKRLIYRWRSKNNWDPFTPEDLTILKELLTNNIFGVDKNKKAVLVTAFSLTLTLCDQLSPKVIWDKLRFDNLKEKNLINNDFFKLIEKEEIDTDFDLVIGNPPFIKELTESAKKIESIRTSENKCKLPDSYSLTFLFLRESIQLLNSKGNSCLIVPASTFLHKKESFDFYKSYIKKFNTPLIIDFSPLRRFLFPSATIATIAIFTNKQKSESDEILHLVTRRTKTTKEKVLFEIDKYDFFKIPKKLSYKHRYIWKVNLFGGGFRSFDFVKKYFNNKNSFHSYLEKKCSENILSKRNNGFPLLAIKKNVGKEPLKSKIFNNTDKVKEDKVFKSETIKIYSNTENINELKFIKEKIEQEKKLYKYLILVTSDRAALSRSASTILPKDIYNLPFTQETLFESIQDTEKILLFDVLYNYENFIRLGENSVILKDVISISKEHKKDYLNDFADVFLKTLNSIYDDYLASDYIETKNHIIFPFYWGDKSRIPQKTDLEKHLNQLLIDNEYPQANLRFIRILTLHDKNVIYLIKPRQYRYWLRSVALHDADEVFVDLLNSEYSYELSK